MIFSLEVGKISLAILFLVHMTLGRHISWWIEYKLFLIIKREERPTKDLLLSIKVADYFFGHWVTIDGYLLPRSTIINSALIGQPQAKESLVFDFEAYSSQNNTIHSTIAELFLHASSV